MLHGMDGLKYLAILFSKLWVNSNENLAYKELISIAYMNYISAYMDYMELSKQLFTLVYRSLIYQHIT
jgi:hypothetical protein